MSKSSFPTLISYLFIPSLWISAPGSTSGSYLSYPIGQSNQTLTGTTTVSGLTIGGSNNITLGDGLVAPTTTQLGYVYSLSAVNQTINNSTNTYLTITSLPVGVYIINANIVNMNGSSGVRVYIFAGSTQLIYGECGSAVTGVSNGGGNVSYFLTNTSVQNITLRAITAISATITGCGMNLQAIKIA
jgi:hypothetical protein